MRVAFRIGFAALQPWASTTCSTRFTFAMVQAFRIGEGFYLHIPVEDVQGKLWDDWPLPGTVQPGPLVLPKKRFGDREVVNFCLCCYFT